MIITVGNTKGGTGKTTVALQLALALQNEKEHKVWFVDGDDQESALTALSIRSEREDLQPLPCSAYSDSRTLLGQVKAQKNVWDDIVIDVGGRDTDTLRAALTIADIVLVPVRPRSMDIWAIEKLVHVLKEAESIGFDVNAYAFISCADAAGSDNEDAKQAIEDMEESGLKFIDAKIYQRKAYTTACAQGLSVNELKSKYKDSKASEEIKTLVKQVLKLDPTAKKK